MNTRRVLLACDLDSQIFGALPLALAFATRGWSVSFAIESIRAVPAPLLDRLARDFSIVERSIGALPGEDFAFDHDAIGVFVTGSRLALFRHLLELSSRVKGRSRPALFYGFNGLVFEKFEEGLAWRLGCDVIGLNSPRDRDAFFDFLHGTDFADQPSVIVGLRRKTDAPPRPMKVAPKPQEEPVSDAADATEADVAIGDDGEAGRPLLSPMADPAAPDDGPNAATASAAKADVIVADDGEADRASAIGSDVSSPTAPEASWREPGEAVPLDVADDGEAGPAPEARDPNGASPSVLQPAKVVESEAAVSEPEPERRKLFVFAEQVVVPRSPRERQTLVAVLARLAQNSPNWDVVIKARVRPDERTFHQQTSHISQLVKEVKKRPSNLSVSYEPLDQLLERADLFATISSTALFDAFDYGVPSMVATDFGLRNADGAHVFFASGLQVRLGELESLDAAPIREPDERWMHRMGYGTDFSPEALIDWLENFDRAKAVAPPAFVSYRTAVGTACGTVPAQKICELWDQVESSLADETAPEDTLDHAGRRAALFNMALQIGDCLRPSGTPPAASKTPPPKPAPLKPAPPKPAPPKPAAGKAPAKPAASAVATTKSGAPAKRPHREDFIARGARKVKMLWLYRRVRATLGIPLK